MRCPKCHYISFESADRCRNCGYEFSLSAPAPEPGGELPLNDRDEDPLPPMDLSLAQVDGLQEAREPSRPIPFDVDRVAGRHPASADLPLFKNGDRMAGTGAQAARALARDPDAPLVRAPAAPRPPIAVRRPTPDAQRLRSRYAAPELPKLALEPDDRASEASAIHDQFESEHREADADLDAPAGRRLLAAAIDLSILGGINAGVLYFTLKLCALPLTIEGALALPGVPFVGFLLLLDAGYIVTFTAAIGQTIGKMATNLQVIYAGEDEASRGEQPNLGFAILRTAAYAASLLPVGLGFLPAFVGKDRRALHDRLAETRVVLGVKRLTPS